VRLRVNTEGSLQKYMVAQMHIGKYADPQLRRESVMKRKPLSTTIDPELKRRARIQAAKDNTNIAEMIDIALTAYLDSLAAKTS